MIEASATARELMQIGRISHDPRSMGVALWLLTWAAVFSDSYAEALEYSQQALAVAVTPLDEDISTMAKGSALIMLRRIEEGLPLLEEHRRQCIAGGHLYNLIGSEGFIGLCKVLQGEIKGGIRLLEEAIARHEREGYRDAADWYRAFLAEIYLQIIEGKERPPFRVILKNLPTFLKVMLTASSRIRTLVTHCLDNPHYDPEGLQIGRAYMMLGLLYKIKRTHAPALTHLTEAKRILEDSAKRRYLREWMRRWLNWADITYGSNATDGYAASVIFRSEIVPKAD